MSNREDKTNPRYTDAPKAAFLSGSGTLSLAKTKESAPGVRGGATPRTPRAAWPPDYHIENSPYSIPPYTLVMSPYTACILAR